MAILPPAPRKQWTQDDLDELERLVRGLAAGLEKHFDLDSAVLFKEISERGKGRLDAHIETFDKHVEKNDKRFVALELEQRLTSGLLTAVVPPWVEGHPGELTFLLHPIEPIVVHRAELRIPGDWGDTQHLVQITRAQLGGSDLCDPPGMGLMLPAVVSPVCPLQITVANSTHAPICVAFIYRYDAPECFR